MNMRESSFERQLEGESRGKFVEQLFLSGISRTEYLKYLKKEKPSVKLEKEYSQADLEKFENWKKVLQAYPLSSEQAIKSSQPWENPRRPENPISRKLYDAVKEKIQAFAPKHMHHELRFYTTVNSHLDLFQGTDAIFEYYEDTGKDEDELLARVSVDVKTSRDTGPTIFNVSQEDSDRIQDLLKEKNMNEVGKIIDGYVSDWSSRIARLIESDIKRNKRR